MQMRRQLTLIVLAVLGNLPGARATEPERAIPVVDLALQPADAPNRADATAAAAQEQARANLLREAAVTGVVLSLREPRRGRSDESLEPAFSAVDRWLARSSDFSPPGCRPSGNRISVWFKLIGAGELAREPSKLGIWTLRGVRFFDVVGSEDNEIGTSWSSPATLIGLSGTGDRVVREIMKSGGVVDISGGSEFTRNDVIRIAEEMRVPVVALSVAARALADDPRNLTDSQLARIGGVGGLVAVGFDEHLIVRGRAATLHDVIAQVRHIATLAGIDHVAIGSGFGMGIRAPDGLENASRFRALARGLLGSGFTPGQVQQVFSGNAPRFLCGASRTEPRARGPASSKAPHP
jgi:membrane dipeptidase